MQNNLHSSDKSFPVCKMLKSSSASNTSIQIIEHLYMCTRSFQAFTKKTRLLNLKSTKVLLLKYELAVWSQQLLSTYQCPLAVQYNEHKIFPDRCRNVKLYIGRHFTSQPLPSVNCMWIHEWANVKWSQSTLSDLNDTELCLLLLLNLLSLVKMTPDLKEEKQSEWLVVDFFVFCRKKNCKFSKEA